MKANYHTHTSLCRHADGLMEEYVLSAIKAGFQELGFSDHTPWKYHSDYISHMRMRLFEFSDYKKEVLRLKEKYKDQISIKLGLECEYFPEYMEWLLDFIKEEELDYILFGNHFKISDEIPRSYYGSQIHDAKGLNRYVEDVIKGMELGCYAYLAHPDLFMRSLDSWDEACDEASRRICAKAKELGVILEYNLAGKMMGIALKRDFYPYPRFWEIAGEYGCKAIVGVDAHTPSALQDTVLYDEGRAYLKEVGCELVDTIPFLR